MKIEYNNKVAFKHDAFEILQRNTAVSHAK